MVVRQGSNGLGSYPWPKPASATAINSDLKISWALALRFILSVACKTNVRIVNSSKQGCKQSHLVDSVDCITYLTGNKNPQSLSKQSMSVFFLFPFKSRPHVRQNFRYPSSSSGHLKQASHSIHGPRQTIPADLWHCDSGPIFPRRHGVINQVIDEGGQFLRRGLIREQGWAINPTILTYSNTMSISQPHTDELNDVKDIRSLVYLPSAHPTTEDVHSATANLSDLNPNLLGGLTQSDAETWNLLWRRRAAGWMMGREMGKGLS